MLLLAGLLIVSLGLVEPRPIWFVLLLMAMVRYGAWALAWLAAAAGIGLLIPAGSVVVRAALGVGLLGLTDWLLGWAGWLNAWSAWGVTIAGWILLVIKLWQLRTTTSEAERETFSLTMPSAGWTAAMPAVGLLLGAACIAPGILWQPSEAAGYDALEYHLQLPAEWERLGSIRGLEHNAYSYLPSLWEAVYMHLAIWSEEPFAWAHSAQLLHAIMAILAAIAIAELVRQAGGSVRAGALAAAAYLAIPWTIVTGSLAYNEQAMMALGAAAMAAAWRPAGPVWLRGLVVGVLCGMAVLVKLTAAGMIVLPILAIAMRDSKRVPLLAGLVAGCAAVVSLWMARNYAWTGNPVFPMLANRLGAGHWTLEQATRWQDAHSPHEPLPGRLALLLSTSRGLLHVQFAWVLWPIAAGATVLALRDPRFRSAAKTWLLVALLQVLFWLVFTHHQSRFLIPLLIPACAVVGLGLTSMVDRPKAAAGAVALVIAVATWLSSGIYLQQAGGLAPLYIDGTDILSKRAWPYSVMNSLPPGSRIYAEGFATPFYLEQDMTYHTVWDTSPIGPSLEQSPGAAALWLRSSGYTHVAIDWDMLARWQSPGNYGYDARVSMSALRKLAAEHLAPVVDQEPLGPQLYRVISD